MKIVCWNINSLRKRQDRLFAWLENTTPDIVCLQETKCTDEQFPALALQSSGYDSAYHGEKSYNGVAILSKTKLKEVRASLCDEVVDPQARVISATIGNLRVSMSRRKMSMFTIQSFGAAQSCAPMASGWRFSNSVKSVFGTRCDCTRRNPAFLPGGIIGCFLFRKIAGCGSMLSWRAKDSPKDVRPRESIARCAKVKILPITRRFGQNSNCDCVVSSR